MTIQITPELPITHDPQIAEVWEKLRRFSFDRGGGPRTFAARLAHEQGWSQEFAAQAIEEYRRFLLLFALDAAERPASCEASPAVRIVPSAVVDKVWHLHLLYTQSYWEDLCRYLLGRPLHHLPADGSGGEETALASVYADTLAAYRRTFGHPAPAAVWPGAEPVAPRRAGRGGFAGPVVVVAGGVFFVATLVVVGILPFVFLEVAVVAAVFALTASNSRRRARGRNGNGGGGESAGAWDADVSGDGSPCTHHDNGHHGGGHDAGGHSHSCGGHSCGGHSCGGHGCGGH